MRSISFLLPQNERCMYMDIFLWVIFHPYIINEIRKKIYNIWDNIALQTLLSF